MQEINAIIKSATLSTADHGCLSSYVHVEMACGGQGFGGYVLYLPEDWKNHNRRGFAGHWVARIMEVAGVEEWSKIIGRPVRVRREDSNSRIKAIGHIIKDIWFIPEEEMVAK